MPVCCVHVYVPVCVFSCVRVFACVSVCVSVSALECVCLWVCGYFEL